jgi:hypothetical protein
MASSKTERQGKMRVIFLSIMDCFGGKGVLVSISHLAERISVLCLRGRRRGRRQEDKEGQRETLLLRLFLSPSHWATEPSSTE